jgi:hypothetical protein
VDEVADQIVDEEAREHIRRLLAALRGIYPEMQTLSAKGPFEMLMYTGPEIIQRLMVIFR